MEFILIQGIGFIGSIINISSFQINNRKKILILQTIVNIIFAIQYFFLHSINSTMMCAIGGIRNLTFSYDNKYNSKVKNTILVCFIISILISTYVNWIGILSLLGCIGSIVATMAVWVKNEKYIRIVSLLATSIWLAHDIVICSYAAIIDGALILISITIGIYRFDIKKISKGCNKMIAEKSCGAIVFKEENDKIYFLTVKHTLGKHWCFPKGHIEEGEREQETALREIKEETGLEVNLVEGFRYPIQYELKDGRIKETVFFLSKAKTDEVSYDTFEIETYKWLEFDEALETLTYENSKNALKEAKAYIEKILV